MRPTIANLVIAGGLAAFDGGVALAKSAASRLGLLGALRRLRR
jgi:hypothetical protein